MVFLGNVVVQFQINSLNPFHSEQNSWSWGDLALCRSCSSKTKIGKPEPASLHVSLVSSACFFLIQNTLLQLGACGGQDRLSCALGRNETGIKVNKKPLIRLLGLSKWQWESLPNYCPYYQRGRESEIESKRARQREGLRGGMKSVTHTNTILIPSDCFVLHFNLNVAQLALVSTLTSHCSSGPCCHGL